MKNYTIKTAKMIENESERVALNFDHIPFKSSELKNVQIVEVFYLNGKLFKVLDMNENGVYVHQLTKKGELNKKTKSTFFYYSNITVAYFEKEEVNELTTQEITVESTHVDLNEVYTTEVSHVKSNEIESEEKEITLLSLSEVIPFVTNKLKEINCIKELYHFKSKLLSTFNNKQQTRKRTLKAKWAMQYNRLTMLFAQYERKLATSN